MRLFDTMFARTAWLILAVVVALCLLLYFVQRNATVLPAIRTSAAAAAELLERNPASLGEAVSAGPPAASWRDRMLAASPAWRAFSSELRDRLGAGTQLEIRSDEAGPVIWVHLPRSPGWISRQMDLPRSDVRGLFLAVVISVVAAILAAAAFLARQLTYPLRRLVALTDRFAAGEPPGEASVGGPVEIRQVQQAFVRLSHSLQAAEQEREALLAGVSHDLRTPISRMRLAVELYGEAADPKLLEELEHDLGELERAAEQFITYSRSSNEEAASLKVLDDVVRHVVEARSVARDSGEDAVAFSAGAPAPLRLETFNVQRLVENLIDNAFRHGRAPVDVRTEQGERFVTLTVRDRGPGVVEANRRSALQPFVRFASSDSPGSGLGLAIAERIARRHGGAVSMASTAAGFEVSATFSRERSAGDV